jgi:hypothetical protein
VGGAAKVAMMHSSFQNEVPAPAAEILRAAAGG